MPVSVYESKQSKFTSFAVNILLLPAAVIKYTQHLLADVHRGAKCMHLYAKKTENLLIHKEGKFLSVINTE